MLYREDSTTNGTSTREPSDRRSFPLRPQLFDAKLAHHNGWVTYRDDGVVLLLHPEQAHREPRVIPVAHQFPLIRATFDDLNKALSRVANSPRLDDGRTLRERYEREVAHYESLVSGAYASGRWEPDYGSYVFDPRHGELYLLAPVEWHRLALVTSNAMMLTDPERALSWQQVRHKLESAVVGFAGLSVGSNLLEGWLREARPRQVKLADPDWLELTNFNRCERASLRHAASDRGSRFDIRNPYDLARVAKTEFVAHEQLMVDPYLETYLYGEGITAENVEQFLLGDGQGEPRLDVLVEEMDDVDMKVLVRQAARRHGIDVLMLSDFGHCAQVLWNGFSKYPAAALGCGASDAHLLESLHSVKSSGRAGVRRFVEALCGDDFAKDQARDWLDGLGEQPTSSTPQPGATAMASGGIGGKELALHVLGYDRVTNSCIEYDLLRRGVAVRKP